MDVENPRTKIFLVISMTRKVFCLAKFKVDSNCSHFALGFSIPALEFIESRPNSHKVLDYSILSFITI